MLADLHVNYESAQEFSLERLENKDVKLDYRVGAMKLIKTDTKPLTRSSTTHSPSDGERAGVRGTLTIRYNHILTLEGIPPEVLDYRLGNRSALEWVIDQYSATKDEHGNITNDPNPACRQAQVCHPPGPHPEIQTVKESI